VQGSPHPSGGALKDDSQIPSETGPTVAEAIMAGLFGPDGFSICEEMMSPEYDPNPPFLGSPSELIKHDRKTAFLWGQLFPRCVDSQGRRG